MMPSASVAGALVGILAVGAVAAHTLVNLAPGHYLVLAAHDPQFLDNLEYRNPDVLRDLSSKGVTVNLTGGQKADVEVPLMPEPSSQQTQVAGAQ